MKQSSGDNQTIPFKQGEQVVYPLQGVGEIRSIEEREFKGDQIPYYIIYLEVSDMTVMVPVHKAEELGIRAIVPAEEAQRALQLIGEEFEPVPADWKVRYQMNLDLLKQGSVIDIATVVRTLYHRSRVKELPILERKLFDSALKLLVDEVSFSLDKKKNEVEVLIFDRLESEGGGPREPRSEEDEHVEEGEGSAAAVEGEDVEEEGETDG